MKITIGADPEIFLTRNKKFISGHGIIPGNKKEPHKVNGGAVQLDGMAAEFNILPVSHGREMRLGIDTVLSELRKMLPDGVDFSTESSANFDETYMASQPDETKVLGCDPDFNAYTGQPNPRPDQHPTMRTAAGHVHIGWEGAEEESSSEKMANCITITRQMDFYLGIPSLILDPKGGPRRTMYGKAGAFRPKSYGVEYRVLSNFWIFSSAYIHWVAVQTKAAIDTLTSLNPYEYYTHYQNIAKNIIDNNDVKNARTWTPRGWLP